MPSKNVSGKATHGVKEAVDLLTKDTTYTDKQRAGLQAAALDLMNGLDVNSLAGKTVTVTTDVFQSASTPSASVSVAFT